MSEKAFHNPYIDSLEVGVLLCRWDGTLVGANPKGAAMLDLSEREPAGRSVFDFLASERTFDEIRCCLNTTGRLAGLETTLFLPATEAEIPVRIDASVVTDTSGERLVLLAVTDLSPETELYAQLMEQENRYRSVFDAISDPIFTVDRNRLITDANQALVDITCRPRRAIVGTNYHTVCSDCDFHMEVSGQRICPVTTAFESGDPVGQVTLIALGQDQPRWWHTNFFPCLGPDGKRSQVVCVMHDVTAEREAQKRVEAANTQLRRALMDGEAKNQQITSVLSELKETQGYLLQSEKMASIGQLAAGVAHEINNPIGFISSNLQTLKDYTQDVEKAIAGYRRLMQTASDNPVEGHPVDLARQMTAIDEETDLNFILDDLPQLLEQSLEGTARIRKIIQDLKEFSHVGRDELEYADLNAGLESTLNIVWNELKYKATVDKDFGEIPLILSYPQQLNQVFMNLLVNAAQALETQGKIIIRTQAVMEPRQGVQIQIRDTGRGMPPEVCRRIFEPFFTTKPVGKGTGLGLSVSYKIIQAHRGQIHVESEVGKGSVFTIFLPVLTDEEFTEGQTPSGGAAANSEPT